jgi:hypothetical protein
MSKLYGTLTNEDSKTSTRCARSIITASAQSYEGSVSVTIRYHDGTPIVEIAAGHGSDSNPSRTLGIFRLDELIRHGSRVSLTLES